MSNNIEETPQQPRKRSWKRILLIGLAIVVGFIVVASVGFVAWANNTPEPTSAAIAALQSDGVVAIQDEDGVLRFEPTGQLATTGLIFYPGGRVDYHAYAAPLRQLAEQGYLVLVPEMPLNLAVFDADSAATLIADNPDIDTWVVGGHSLGGAMAAGFAADNSTLIDGLALWAAYPAAGTDLTASPLEIATIYASDDSLATLDDIDNARYLLPNDAQWTLIEGGNHAQFGSYGVQNGDGIATIDEATQHSAIVAAMMELMARLEE
ncbi:MAG: alpha/beta hydrolase [Anaerolineae bacterium]|nr:alpha/beta hydrolase [Anaerolineae bacterium]